MAKVTSVKPGSAAAGKAAQKPASTERNAAKVVASARQEAARLRAEAKADAARIRQDAEEHARRLVLDARATADGVRAEGMEVVLNLRQISDSLREVSDRVLEDVAAIHSRMVGELQRVDPDGAPEPEPPGDEPNELDVPDFLARN